MTPDYAHIEWMKSALHRKNVLDPAFSHAGVGVYCATARGRYFTVAVVELGADSRPSSTVPPPGPPPVLPPPPGIGPAPSHAPIASVARVEPEAELTREARRAARSKPAASAAPPPPAPTVVITQPLSAHRDGTAIATGALFLGSLATWLVTGFVTSRKLRRIRQPKGVSSAYGSWITCGPPAGPSAPASTVRRPVPAGVFSSSSGSTVPSERNRSSG